MRAKTWWLLLQPHSSILMIFVISSSYPVTAKPIAPALYVFGDSLFDSGNNNLLPTLARANYLPYGVDFFEGPTGRFSNGRTVADFIAEYLGLPYAPPYFSIRRRRSVKGINYASGSCGILPETGTILRLYEIGARKVIVFEIGPVGCIPSITRKHKHQGQCVEEFNKLVTYFNDLLPTMLKNLTSTLPGSTFIHGRAHWIGYDAVTKPQNYGLVDSVNPCCKTWFNGTSGCIPFSSPCHNIKQHYFWDAFHLTEPVYSVIATHCFNGTDVCSPMNIKQLATI
uniref:GDSL esterase/lipase n=1 Tax=Kalanchoe fedtschenkoi TaxID=63787 RepID=A0A7N0VGQ9_KALFE